MVHLRNGGPRLGAGARQHGCALRVAGSLGSQNRVWMKGNPLIEKTHTHTHYLVGFPKGPTL